MKTYVLPISKNYVHNWKVEDAIREILQNAIDAQTDGHRMQVQYSEGDLIITTTGVDLSINSLVLGNTSKTDHTKYIGTYGEGFKLALVVLLRNDLDVTIYTNQQIWRPEFRFSKTFKEEILHIDISADDNVYNQSRISYHIRGIEYELFETIRDNSLAMSRAMGYSIGHTLNSDYGEILLEPRYKGKMFVNGLYVQSDSTFQYGYNFKPEYVPLDRDRRAIYYYKLRELTAKAMTSQSDMKIVQTAITKSYVDIRSIADYINDVNKEFKTNFAHEFIKTHELDEDTFVGLEKEVKVANKPKSFVTDSRVIAELVNAGLEKDYEYYEIKEKAKDLDKIEEAWLNYHGSHFEKLIDYLLEHKDNFEVSELVDNLRNWTDLHTDKFDFIANKVFAAFDIEED